MIDLKNADPNFKYEIVKQEGGEGLLKCFGCSDCAASCPVRYFDERYNPRKIIRLTLLGMKKEVLSSPFLWLCAHCHACTERCPQGIMVAELINAIKNYAVTQGYCPEAYKMQLDLLKKMGRLYEVEDFDLKKRQRIGLPPVDKTIPEVAKILEHTGIEKYLHLGNTQIPQSEVRESSQRGTNTKSETLNPKKAHGNEIQNPKRNSGS